MTSPPPAPGPAAYDIASPDDTIRTRVAFIGGHGRSGSTLLCRLLEGLDDVCSVGELRNLWDHGVLRDRPCACGQPFSQCAFWQGVGQEAFGGWDEQVARRALRLRRRVDRVRSVPRLMSRRSGSAFAAEADEYAALLASVYAAAARVSGARVVVDSSKLPSTGFLMRRSPALEPRVVHLVRDSRGVAFSWSKVVHRADTGGDMARSRPSRTALRWELFNVLTDQLARQGLPRLLVRYEDLVGSPASQLRRIADFLGLAPEASELDFVAGDLVELPVDHSVWGNPVRSTSGPQRLRLDTAWREGLSTPSRVAVTMLSLPGLRRYGYLRPDRGGASA